MKNINNISHLVGGQLYIRAVCNLWGKTWIEVLKYNGKPFKKNDSYTLDSYKLHLTNVIEKDRYGDGTKYACDAGIKTYGLTRLFCFSNKTYNKLQSVVNNRMEFLSILLNRKVSDNEMKKFINGWVEQHRFDEEMNQSYYKELYDTIGMEYSYQSEKEYPYLNDVSIQHLFVKRVKPLKQEDIYTVEDFEKASPFPGRSVIITPEEAFGRAANTNRLVSVSSHNRNVFFFTTDHCFGARVLPKDFVPHSMSFPLDVVPRPGCEDGITDTFEKYCAVFEKDATVLRSTQELVDFLNKEYSCQ